MKVILTGATGMLGEGVLLECLAHAQVEAVLCVNRKPTGRSHPKLKEYIVPEFLDLKNNDENLEGYDACFFCAGISSIGMNEADYTRITYDTTIHFAKVVLEQNPQIAFTYVSGTATDSSEKGKIMWARVKGKTENALAAMPFKNVYLFRPGLIQAAPGQKNLLPLYKYLGWIFPLFKFIFPNKASTMKQIGQAMINAVLMDYPKHILEVKDINKLAGE